MLAALLVVIGVLAPPLASSSASAEVKENAALQAAPADLEALGVIVNPRSGGSVAVLRSGARTRVVALGETAFGGRVAAIGESSVWLDFGGARVEVRLPVASAEHVPAAAAADPLEDPQAPAREMARDEVQRRLALETPRILTETTLVPVQDEQRVTGFALTRIPEGSLLSDAGLRAGDVLTAINDVPIDSLATLMALWPRLQHESRLNALVLRDGRPVSLTVTLR
jgi:type II secretion system protein C